MSQSSASSQSGPLIFGNSSNESPWTVPAIIAGFVVIALGVGWLFVRNQKGK